MMVAVYEVNEFHCKVRKVEADKVTDKTVVVNGSRRNRRSDWNSYFDHESDAIEYAISKLRAKIKNSLSEIKRSEETLCGLISDMERTCQKS